MDHLPEPASPPSAGSGDVLQKSRVTVRIAETTAEIRAAQKLRYKVFYEEFGATPNEAMILEGRDFDEYDPLTDHVIVVDESKSDIDDQVVGTYRLLRQDKLPGNFPFYTSNEFDISSLLASGNNLLELGRSCVLPDYRTRPVLHLLWQRIGRYLTDHRIDMMFGCASLPGTNIADVSEQLAYLYHYHRAPDAFCPTVLPALGVDMNTMPKDQIEAQAKRIFSDLPPLIKGYLRVGCYVGNGAFIDKQWDSIDVCIVIPTAQLDGKYTRHYDRANQRDDAALLGLANPSPDNVSAG